MARLTAREAQVERGWVRMLDVDLSLAQRMLRLPAADRPVPPLALPAVLTETWDGGREVLAPAIAAPEPDEPVAVAAPSRELRGAYARRARNGS